MGHDNNKLTYTQKITLNNKTPEEQAKIIELFNKNINIAYKVAAKYYKTQYWDKEESLQIAQLGLFKACLIWDPEKYKLTTLAYNIINRDFIDYDKQQKRQPDIIFSLDEDIKSGEDIVIGDIIQDENSIEPTPLEINDSMRSMNEDILYILDTIADDFHIRRSLVKMIYLVNVDSVNNGISKNQLKFIKKSVINEVMEELQRRLKNFLEYNN